MRLFSTNLPVLQTDSNSTKMDKRFCSIFSTEDYLRITSGVKFAQCMIQAHPNLQDSAVNENAARQLEDLTVSDAWSCSCCGLQFSDSASQRSHFKLDWHRYNIKRQLAGLSAVKEEAFDTLADKDDMESISGSESENETESEESSTVSTSNAVNISRHAKVFFENDAGQVFSLFRNVLLRKKEDIETDSEAVINLVREVPIRDKWAIVMIGGGHFAACVFKGDEPTVHKTFHSYTVRAKQGGAQSSRDSRGNHPKSAGASLRRYNEQMLLQHIQDIVAQWKDELKGCHLIFYRAVGPQNRGILFGGKSPPFEKADERLRSIPFPTRRATFNEVKRVHGILSTVEVHGLVKDIQASIPKSPPKKVSSNDSKENEAADATTSRRTKTKTETTPKIDRARSRPSPMRPPPVELVSSSDSEATSVEWTCHEQEFASNLEEYGDSFNQDGVLSPKAKKDSYLRREWMKMLRPSDELKKKEAEEEAERLKRAKEKEKERKKIAAERKAMRAAAEALKRQKEAEEIAKDPLKKFRFDLLEVINDGDPQKVKDCLHSVTARGLEKQLLSILNSPIDGANPPLHVAARAGHTELISVLLDAGASPCGKNKKLQVPYVVACNKETQKAFCKYLQENRSRFNYSESLIPEPISEEKARELAEKKKVALKARRDRAKEKKKQEEIERKEAEDRERFLALSDREKRALAAERRILAAQAAATPSAKPIVLSRCYFCAIDISGAVPFEYDHYRFCSMECLKGHRLKAKEASAKSVQ